MKNQKKNTEQIKESLILSRLNELVRTLPELPVLVQKEEPEEHQIRIAHRDSKGNVTGVSIYTLQLLYSEDPIIKKLCDFDEKIKETLNSINN